jgi:predicted dehydrogenase
VLSIGHVLRFTPFYAEVAAAVRAGRLGELVNINQTECVGQWHFAQSFVRGNWASASASAPSILAKCCHDLDIIRWLTGSPVRRLVSFGNLFEFRREKAPGPTPERCTDGCPYEESCPHSAYKHYLEPARFWVATFPKREHPDPIARLEWLRRSPYSRCVYRLDNDVCDQQIVTMEFESGATATLTMMAHTRDDTRTLRISGTRGELHGHLVGNDIRIRDFISDKETRITPEVIHSGHMGGDLILIDRFLDAARAGGTEHLSSARESLESHLLCFAAEQSRCQGGMVVMNEFTRAIAARV